MKIETKINNLKEWVKNNVLFGWLGLIILCFAASFFGWYYAKNYFYSPTGDSPELWDFVPGVGIILYCFFGLFVAGIERENERKEKAFIKLICETLEISQDELNQKILEHMEQVLEKAHKPTS